MYIIGHVPPGMFEKKRSKPWYRPHFNRRYLELIRKHHAVIKGQFFGHHHTDAFRMFYDANGNFKCIFEFRRNSTKSPYLGSTRQEHFGT